MAEIDDWNKQFREREEAARVARKAREELSKTAGIRLQDAVVGKFYRVTALYSGDTDVFQYTGCKGSHDHEAHGVPVGAIAYFKHLVYNCHYLHSTSQLEPGGLYAQWFMVPLTDAEAAAAPAEFEKARREKEDKEAASLASLPS